MSDYLVQFNNISKFFGKVIALKNVTMKLKKGEIMCLLGDNGAGKSTLIKTLAGVHRPDEGEIIVEGKKTVFDSPKDALDMGIATVYQDLALVSLMSVTRNFFMGREPKKGFGPFAPEIYTLPYPNNNGLNFDNINFDPKNISCAVIEPMLGEGGFVPASKSEISGVQSFDSIAFSMQISL